MAKKKSAFDRILGEITPERRAEIEAQVDATMKWHDEHPDHHERYGTDRSYWLEEIRAKGFNPIGITVMACEETIIMETKEETDAAWKEFAPEGWWYPLDKWEETRKWYVDDMYEGIEADAPKVYCLDERFKEIIK
ncbi:MAG: hypothetical protein AABY15_03310 [Nanoarchaeota archaeon]